jgi:hypothetical protein
MFLPGGAGVMEPEPDEGVDGMTMFMLSAGNEASVGTLLPQLAVTASARIVKSLNVNFI